MGELFSFPNAESNRPNQQPSDLAGASSAKQSGNQGPQASDANSDEAFDFEVVDPDQPAQPESAPAQAVHVPKQERAFERRKRRRAIISAPVRVRSVDVTDGGPDEVLTTTNVSRTGILFHTFNRTYSREHESGRHVSVQQRFRRDSSGALGTRCAHFRTCRWTAGHRSRILRDRRESG